MTYSKTVNNNFIFSVCASRVIIVINLGHASVQFVTNLFIPPFPQRWNKRLDLNIERKTSVHGSSECAGCTFDKAYFAARSASSFPMISLARNPTKYNEFTVGCYFLTCVRPCLQEDSYWPGFQWPVIQTSENLTKRSTEETFTYFKGL